MDLQFIWTSRFYENIFRCSCSSLDLSFIERFWKRMWERKGRKCNQMFWEYIDEIAPENPRLWDSERKKERNEMLIDVRLFICFVDVVILFFFFFFFLAGGPFIIGFRLWCVKYSSLNRSRWMSIIFEYVFSKKFWFRCLFRRYDTVCRSPFLWISFIDSCSCRTRRKSKRYHSYFSSPFWRYKFGWLPRCNLGDIQPFFPKFFVYFTDQLSL